MSFFRNLFKDHAFWTRVAERVVSGVIIAACTVLFTLALV